MEMGGDKIFNRRRQLERELRANRSLGQSLLPVKIILHIGFLGREGFLLHAKQQRFRGGEIMTGNNPGAQDY